MNFVVRGRVIVQQNVTPMNLAIVRYRHFVLNGVAGQTLNGILRKGSILKLRDIIFTFSIDCVSLVIYPMRIVDISFQHDVARSLSWTNSRQRQQ